jgi:hypothetical protein
MHFRIPAPVSALFAVAVIAAMVIFFGSWAVSADTKELGRTLSVGLTGNAGQLGGYDKSSTDGNQLVDYSKSPVDPFKQAWPGANQEGGSAEDQTWWEKSLLNA